MSIFRMGFHKQVKFQYGVRNFAGLSYKKVRHENNGQLEDCCIRDVNLMEYFLVLGLFTRLWELFFISGLHQAMILL